MPSTSLPPSVLEAGLLSSLNSADRLARLEASGLTSEDFYVWTGVFKFILHHHDQYASFPTAEILKNKFEEWDPPQGEFDYWLHEFLRHIATRKAEILLKDAKQAIIDSPELAIPELASKLASLQYAGNTHVVATDASIAERFKLYQKREAIYQESQGDFLWGIPTGLGILDSTHQGWMEGELVGFYARPTVGKTWMLVREAAIAWANGYRVLLISPEVSARHVALRIDVFLARALGIRLSHKGIFVGEPSQEQAYAAAVQAIQQEERWWTVDSINGRALSLRDIKSYVQQFQPDMVCIDGIMLMEDEKRNSQIWEKMDHLCYGLKNMATALDLVVMTSHQAVNTRKGQRGHGNDALGRGDDHIMPTLNDASGGEAFVRACTTVFTMAPDLKHERLRWYSVRKTRERWIEQWKPRYALGWDVDSGNIKDLSELGEDMPKIEQEIAQL